MTHVIRVYMLEDINNVSFHVRKQTYSTNVRRKI